MSFDAPVAYFGLGAKTAITGAENRWPDGQVDHLQNLPAGGFYRFTR